MIMMTRHASSAAVLVHDMNLAVNSVCVFAIFLQAVGRKNN